MINQQIKQLLSSYDTQSSPLIYRRAVATASLALIIVISSALFVLVNFAKGNLFLVFLDVFFMISTSYALYLLLYRGQLEFTAIFSASLVFIFMIFFIESTKNHGFELIWTITYPLYAIPILGKKKGLITLFLYYSILTPMAYLGIGEWDNGYWDLTSFFRFIVVSSACLFSAYFFESSAIKAYKILESSLDNEKIYLAQLEELATTDQLTGLHNRRYFDTQFKLEAQKVRRYSTNLSLIMLDIDHFKAVNDQFGHPIGDQVLIEFSSLLKSSLRETDILARWGGEEFVVLLPQTSLSDASIIADKARIMIKNHHFKTIDKMTASIGVTAVSANPESETSALLQADRALYKAKNNGRDQIVVSDSQ